MKKQLLFYALVCISVGIFAQSPDWINPNQRKLKYSERDYIVGFASENNVNRENPNELLIRLESYAKGQVAEYIQVTVRSEALLTVAEEGNKFTQSFSSINHSATNLVLSGVQVQTYYAQRERVGYAFVYAKRTDLLSYYLGDLSTKLSESERLINQSSNLLRSNAELAFKYALEALTLVAEIEQAQSVVLALKRSDFEKDSQIDRIVKLKTSIDNVLREVNSGSGNTLDDACFFIARALKLQTGSLNAPVMLSNFTYQDTRIGSELSNRINHSLTSRLVSTAGYNVLSTGSTAAGYLLTGTYWKNVNEIRLIANLRETNGKIVATAEAIIPMHWVSSSSIKYLPENFEDAYARMKVFGQNEIMRGDLNVEVWTNKGDDNLVFTEGERLKFFIRANKESYIRFVYHLADNQSALMLDNYYVAAHMVNKVIELPDEFECAAPFGVETLQINAQSKPFDNLITRSQYGYQFINEPLNDALTKTRGFVRVTNETIDKAEKRIVFTTLQR